MTDIEMLKIVRRYLIDTSTKVYRDYKFFLQAENIPQRRKIYNSRVDLNSKEAPQQVVCKTLCELAKRDLTEKYNLDVELITCDNDEFGHYDILVTNPATGHKFVINCFSDLELNQCGMRSKRFASKAYIEERYPEKIDEYSYITKEQLKEIDEELGYLEYGMYFDEYIALLAKEFENIKEHLVDDIGLRRSLDIYLDIDNNCEECFKNRQAINQQIRETTDPKEIQILRDYLQVIDRQESVFRDYIKKIIDQFTTEDILHLKFEFLSRFFNDRGKIKGHIELTRFFKILIRKFFTAEEIDKFRAYNCYFDRDSSKKGIPLFSSFPDSRVRFICFDLSDTVFLASTTNKESLKMGKSEWESFKKINNVVCSQINTSPNTLAEVLRNEGIGVNILKHAVLKKKISNIEDIVFGDMSSQQTKMSPNSVSVLNGDLKINSPDGRVFEILLNPDKIVISVDGKQTTYFYEGDTLTRIDEDGRFQYIWKDEGKYERIECPVESQKSR